MNDGTFLESEQIYMVSGKNVGHVGAAAAEKVEEELDDDA